MLPDAIVTRLTDTINTYVQKQDKAKAHVSVIPYSAPALAIEVTLPVPMMYPMMKSPGPIARAAAHWDSSTWR